MYFREGLVYFCRTMQNHMLQLLQQHGFVVEVSRSPVELHFISQHPSGHSPALRHNHSHLTSIRESSSPVATNQAHYITALNPDHHYLASRLQALHLSHRLPAGSPLLCGCLPPVDSTKGRDKDFQFLSLLIFIDF